LVMVGCSTCMLLPLVNDYVGTVSCCVSTSISSYMGGGWGATFSVPWLVKLLNIALKRKCLKIDCLLYYTVQNYIICARN